MREWVREKKKRFSIYRWLYFSSRWLKAGKQHDRRPMNYSFYTYIYYRCSCSLLMSHITHHSFTYQLVHSFRSVLNNRNNNNHQWNFHAYHLDSGQFLWMKCFSLATNWFCKISQAKSKWISLFLSPLSIFNEWLKGNWRIKEQAKIAHLAIANSFFFFNWISSKYSMSRSRYCINVYNLYRYIASAHGTMYTVD